MYRFLILLIAGVCAMTSLPAHAQDREVPYWASIRAEVLNMRVGPSQDYRIEWVYKRKGLPMKVVRVMEGWRLVQDPDGAQGWVVARLLNPQRSAIVVGEGNGVNARAQLSGRNQRAVVEKTGDLPCQNACPEKITARIKGNVIRPEYALIGTVLRHNFFCLRVNHGNRRTNHRGRV